jgi:class 3 adenylate cyclase
MSHLQALMELGNLEMMAGISGDGLRQARIRAREAGAYTTLVLADLSLLWWLRYMGEIDEALVVGDEAVSLCRRFRLDLLPHALVSAGTTLDTVAGGTGESLLAEGVGLAPEDPDVVIVAEASRGESAIRAGDFERAAGHLARAAEVMARVPPTAVQLPAPFQRIGVLLALGREGEAREALAEASDLPRGKIYQLSYWYDAAEALVAGSPGDVETAMAPAVHNAPYSPALALLLGAEVLGDPHAERWLHEALAVFEAAGGREDAARIRRRLQERGAPVPSPAARRERATFMFTDIVGSTVLVEALGDEAWGHLLRWHDETLRGLFVVHGGQEVKQVGDGFFVAFTPGPSALECAIAIQRALERHRRDHGFAPRVRIGLHEAEATRKGSDYEGKGVHEAARIGALAEGGEIVASRSTVGRLRGFATSEDRTVTLKGITEPVAVVTVAWQ